MVALPLRTWIDARCVDRRNYGFGLPFDVRPTFRWLNRMFTRVRLGMFAWLARAFSRSGGMFVVNGLVALIVAFD